MSYDYYFILSFFNAQRPTSKAQLVHVFQGKRTPSMFYLTEVNKWHHSFSKFKTFSDQKIDSWIQELLLNHLITPMNKGFIITERGSTACQTFFEKHYYPKYIHTFANTNIRVSFWERFQLFTQVFSEMSFKNNKYAAIIKQPHHQENIRQLFYQFKDEKSVLLINWINEVNRLFSKMDEKRANILASQLTGYERIGFTKNQVQNRLEMHPIEYDYFHQDSIEIILEVINQNKEEFSLLHAIIIQLHKETNFGLSISTHETYQLIKQGYSIREISKVRRIKENTVREHILEIAFIIDDFSIHHFVPPEIYDYLHHYFEKNDKFTYKQIVFEKPEVEFMHFRLVDLERMRNND